MGLQLMESRSHCDGLQIRTINGQGKGVFAGRSYKKNDEILIFGGEYKQFTEISDFTHYLQISPDIYLSPSGSFDDYVNHSCNPNCAVFFFDSVVVLKAIKNIKKHNQLTFDYGTILFNEPTRFECFCGSKKCRKVISHFFSMPTEKQNYFLKNGLVPLLSKYSRSELGC